MVKRCSWADSDNEILKEYHDHEWGTPYHNNHQLFELLSLEIMQAGLNWQIILNKRPAFRKAFENFDYQQVQYFENKLPELLADSAIIRNKLKINAIINNAQIIVRLAKKGISFNDYLWKFVDFQPRIHHYQQYSEVPSTDDLAKKVSKQMKHDGFKFTGPVVIYSFLQSAGLINDHETTCFRYQQIKNAETDSVPLDDKK